MFRATRKSYSILRDPRFEQVFVYLLQTFDAGTFAKGVRGTARRTALQKRASSGPTGETIGQAVRGQVAV